MPVPVCDLQVSHEAHQRDGANRAEERDHHSGNHHRYPSYVLVTSKPVAMPIITTHHAWGARQGASACRGGHCHEHTFEEREAHSQRPVRAAFGQHEREGKPDQVRVFAGTDPVLPGHPLQPISTLGGRAEVDALLWAAIRCWQEDQVQADATEGCCERLKAVLASLTGVPLLQDVYPARHAEPRHPACGPGSAQDQAEAPREASR